MSEHSSTKLVLPSISSLGIGNFQHDIGRVGQSLDVTQLGTEIAGGVLSGAQDYIGKPILAAGKAVGYAADAMQLASSESYAELAVNSTAVGTSFGVQSLTTNLLRPVA